MKGYSTIQRDAEREEPEPQGLREELDNILVRIMATSTRDLPHVVAILRRNGF